MNLLKFDPAKLQSFGLKQRVFIIEYIAMVSSIILVFLPDMIPSMWQLIYFVSLIVLKYFLEGFRENIQMFLAGVICQLLNNSTYHFLGSVLIISSIYLYQCYFPLKPGPYNIGYDEMTLPDTSIRIAIYYPTNQKLNWMQKVFYSKQDLVKKLQELKLLNELITEKKQQASIEKFQSKLSMTYFNNLSLKVIKNAKPFLETTVQMIILCPDLGYTDSLYQFLIQPLVSQGFVVVSPMLDDIILPLNYSKLQEFSQSGIKIFREQQIIEREETIKEILKNANEIARYLNPKLSAKVALGIGKGLGANAILNLGNAFEYSIVYEPEFPFLPIKTTKQNVLFFRTKQYCSNKNEIKEEQGRDRIAQWKNKNAGFSFVCGFYNMTVGNFSDLSLINPKGAQIDMLEMETLMQNQIAFLYYFLQIIVLDEASENNMDKVVMKYMELYEKNLPVRKRKNLLFVDYFGKDNN